MLMQQAAWQVILENTFTVVQMGYEQTFLQSDLVLMNMNHVTIEKKRNFSFSESLLVQWKISCKKKKKKNTIRAR